MGIIIWRIQLATVILARTAIKNLRKNIRKRSENSIKRVKNCRRGVKKGQDIQNLKKDSHSNFLGKYPEKRTNKKIRK